MKRINLVSTAVLNIGLSIIENTLVNQIPIESIQDDVKLILKPIRKMIKVLSDKDPNNEAQVKEVWLDFLKSQKFNDSYQNRIMQAINLIEDDNVKDFVRRIAKPCLDTIQALYDDNLNDVEQIRDTWIEFATEKENINSILVFFFKDEDVRESIAVVIDSVHDGIADILLK